MKQNKKITRCGYCGVFMLNGSVMSADECKKFKVDSIDSYTLGWCYDCANYERDEEQRQRVTRDMAIDAGDLSLEGQLI